MPTPRPAVEFTPRRSPQMALIVLSCSEALLAMKTAGSQATDGETRREMLRHALRMVGGQAVRYAELQGDDFGGHFPHSRHRLTAIRAFNRLHEPSIDARERLRDKLEFEDGADGERCIVSLPDGRTVILCEVSERTVEQLFADARRESSSGAFAGLRTLISTMQAAIVSIDGVKVKDGQLAGRGWDQHFSIKETLLLGDALNEMQDDDLGEGSPAPLGSASGSSGG